MHARLFAMAWLPVLAASALANPPNPVYESPGGKFRIVEEDDRPTVVFQTPPRKVPLPDGSQGPHKGNDFFNPDEEFHASPDEQWLFALHHVGSGLRDGNLFRVAGSTIEIAKKAAPFSELAWKAGLKLGALKANFSADGLYAMTFFEGWSADSARLLVRLGGGEKKSAFTYRFLYFNTVTQAFEVTDYLRRLNKLTTTPLACAEPLTALPEEAALRASASQADDALNKAYRAKLGTMEKARAENLRDDQREWIKQRDAGVAPFVASFPAAEKERRRLQYLAAVTAARTDTVRWESE